MKYRQKNDRPICLSPYRNNDENNGKYNRLLLRLINLSWIFEKKHSKPAPAHCRSGTFPSGVSLSINIGDSKTASPPGRLSIGKCRACRQFSLILTNTPECLWFAHRKRERLPQFPPRKILYRPIRLFSNLLIQAGKFHANLRIINQALDDLIKEARRELRGSSGTLPAPTWTLICYQVLPT